MIKFKQKLNKSGFSLIETLVYIFITAMLLAVISNLLMANFNIRRQLKASNLLYNDARFIIGQLNNRVHSMTDITNFSLQVENNNLIYRETAQPDLTLNSSQIKVSNLVLTPVNDSLGNTNRGVLINFNLSTGDQSDIYGYLNKNFETFISLR